MFLDTTRREFERGYIANTRTAGAGLNAPERLLLFYGLECGLKAQIMKERRAEITSELPLIREIGHDLRECLKALHAPADLTLRAARTIQKKQQLVPNSLLHQAFRYGIELDDSAGVVAELQKVRRWLIERMR
jgi:hypothetical protein